MLENKFKTGLVKELKTRFPGCMVVHLDPNEIQGINCVRFAMTSSRVAGTLFSFVQISYKETTGRMCSSIANTSFAERYFSFHLRRVERA